MANCPIEKTNNCSTCPWWLASEGCCAIKHIAFILTQMQVFQEVYKKKGGT